MQSYKINHIESLFKFLENELKNIKNVVITGHINPDPDCYGSVVSLTEILKVNYPENNYYVVLEENSKLKDILPYEYIHDENFLPDGEFISIVLDTSGSSRVFHKQYDKSKVSFKIDHHPDTEDFTTYKFVDTKMSSASELVIKLSFYFNTSSTDIYNLGAYFGIVGDTGRFLYDNVTEDTLRKASHCLYGNTFNPKKDIHDKLDATSLDYKRYVGFILSNFKVKGNVSYILIEENIHDVFFNLLPHELGNPVNEMSGIEGIDIWLLAYEVDGKYRVRIRSNELHINEVAKKYNGGGHPLASGAEVNSLYEFNNLIVDLQKLKYKGGM